MSRGERSTPGGVGRWVTLTVGCALVLQSAGAIAGAADAAGDRIQQEAPAPVQRYLDSVQALEAEGGAWAAALQQELLGLGLVYQQQGRHAEAVAALSRAEHITRINEGLYSRADLPVLERLIESHAALGDWEKVQNRYRQVFVIYRRNYGDNDERLVPVLNRLSAWHMRAYLDGIGKDPVQHLLSARQFYDSAVTILETNHGPQERRIAEALRRRALVDYYVAGQAPLVRESTGFGSEQNEQMAIQTQIANSFASGRDALRRAADLLDRDVTSNPLERSEALAELADWHQLFARRQSALRLYQEAWAHGERSGSEAAQIRDVVFGKPRPLPLLPADISAVPMPHDDTGWISVRFSVNENGRASGMQVLESSPPASEREVQRLRRRISTTTFRPRFENGQPVATENVDYQYSYTP